jgi:hypothetical protein
MEQEKHKLNKSKAVHESRKTDLVTFANFSIPRDVFDDSAFLR